ncbi:MAG: hypothetical protein LBK13_13895 [Spirochaetales bacterium]|nr:hypothetical protein [Spirochaetales bacterium]
MKLCEIAPEIHGAYQSGLPGIISILPAAPPAYPKSSDDALPVNHDRIKRRNIRFIVIFCM